MFVNAEQVKLKYCFTLIKGLNITKADLLDEGIPCVSYGQIHSKYGFEVDPKRHILPFVSENYLATNPNSLMRYGDFVFADTSEDIEGSGNFTYLNSYTPAFAGYHTIIVRPKTAMNYRYLAYYFDSPVFRSQIQRKVNGVKVYSITRSILHNTQIIFPSGSEQSQIVRYLDWKVSRINKLINAKQWQIELLREMRQATINDTITKGGENWAARRLKTIVKDTNIKGSPNDSFYIGMENIASWTSEYIGTDIIVEGDSKTFINGDVLFGKLRPYLAKVYTPNRNGFCSSEFLVLRDFKGHLPFLKYFLLSYDFIMLVNASTYGAKMPRASWDFIGNCRVALPLPNEQETVAKQLDKQFECINTVIGKLNDEITLLHEYRTRLISDVVTGKLNVQYVDVPEFKSVDSAC